MGGVCYCRGRNWSILAAFPADEGGVHIEEPETRQSPPHTRRADASAGHQGVVTAHPRNFVGSVYTLRRVNRLSAAQLSAAAGASPRANLRGRTLPAFKHKSLIWFA